MKENLEMAVFFIFVTLALVCGLCPIIAAVHESWQESKKKPPRFDERQRLTQARAAVHALVALVAYLLIWAALDIRGLFAWTEEVMPLVLMGLLMAHLIWTAECILKGAWTGWKDGQPALGGTLLITPLVSWYNIFHERGGVWHVSFGFLCADILVLLALVIYDERRRKREKREGGEI